MDELCKHCETPRDNTDDPELYCCDSAELDAARDEINVLRPEVDRQDRVIQTLRDGIEQLTKVKDAALAGRTRFGQDNYPFPKEIGEALDSFPTREKSK